MYILTKSMRHDIHIKYTDIIGNISMNKGGFYHTGEDGGIFFPARR
jgi:hypothetical protein